MSLVLIVSFVLIRLFHYDLNLPTIPVYVLFKVYRLVSYIFATSGFKRRTSALGDLLNLTRSFAHVNTVQPRLASEAISLIGMCKVLKIGLFISLRCRSVFEFVDVYITWQLDLVHDASTRPFAQSFVREGKSNIKRERQGRAEWAEWSTSWAVYRSPWSSGKVTVSGKARLPGRSRLFYRPTHTPWWWRVGGCFLYCFLLRWATSSNERVSTGWDARILYCCTLPQYTGIRPYRETTT